MRERPVCLFVGLSVGDIAPASARSAMRSSARVRVGAGRGFETEGEQRGRKEDSILERAFFALALSQDIRGGGGGCGRHSRRASPSGRAGGEGANAAEGNKRLAFELCFRCFRLSASCITGPLSYLAAHLSLVIDIERRPSGCLGRPHGSAGEKGTQDENLILNNRLKSSACRNVATVRSCMIKGLAFPAIHASVHVFSRKTDITRERNVKKQDKPTHLPKISVETQVGKNNYEKVKR